MNKNDEFKIVVLECPYNHWNDPRVQELFQKAIDLKLSGYLHEYPYGVLPMDATDFIGTQHLLCRETRDGLVPLSGFKTITNERCRIHGQSFPGLGLVRAAKAKTHEMAMQEILDRCESSHVSLGYMGSWTIDPQIRRNRELTRQVRDVIEAMYVLYHLEHGISEAVIGGTLRFKTEQWFSRWGHRPLTWQGKALPPISVAHLLGESVLVMHLKEFAKDALTRTKPWEDLWRNRLTVSAPDPATGAIRKAA